MSEAARRQDAATRADNAKRGGGDPASAALAVGAMAALLVGSCCVVPVVLVAIGLGGAWLSNLAALEPYRPVFAAIALLCLAFAWRRIYRPTGECKPGEVCSVPAVRRGYRIGFWTVAVLLIVTFGFPYVAPFIL